MTTPRLRHGLIRQSQRLETLRALESIAADGKAYDRLLTDKLLAERQWRRWIDDDPREPHTQPTMREGQP